MLHIILQFYAPIPLPSTVWLVEGSVYGFPPLYMGMDIAIAERGPLVQKNACVVCVWLYLYILFWYVQSVATAFVLVSYVLLKDLIYVYLISIFKIWNFIILWFPYPEGSIYTHGYPASAAGVGIKGGVGGRV